MFILVIFVEPQDGRIMVVGSVFGTPHVAYLEDWKSPTGLVAVVLLLRSFERTSIRIIVSAVATRERTASASTATTRAAMTSYTGRRKGQQRFEQ